MSQTTPAGRSANVNFRVAPEQRELIDQAARLAHKTRTDFIVEAATRAAWETILDERLFVVSGQAYDAFAAALDRPAAEDGRLRDFLAERPAWEK
jgi:uncharacterized protein (DUF1778 family)